MERIPGETPYPRRSFSGEVRDLPRLFAVDAAGDGGQEELEGLEPEHVAHDRGGRAQVCKPLEGSAFDFSDSTGGAASSDRLSRIVAIRADACFAMRHSLGGVTAESRWGLPDAYMSRGSLRVIRDHSSSTDPREKVVVGLGLCVADGRAGVSRWIGVTASSEHDAHKAPGIAS